MNAFKIGIVIILKSHKGNIQKEKGVLYLVIVKKFKKFINSTLQ